MQIARHINRFDYIFKLILTNPFEIFSYLPTAWATFKYRFLLRCSGKGTIVGRGTNIINFSKLTIGNHCLIMDHVYIRCGVTGKVAIGDYCAVNSHAKLFGHGGIYIGQQSQVGPAAILTTTSHDHSANLEADFKPIHIGNQSWIGAGAIILPGVSIGDNTIIGAGSIVNKSVGSNVLAAGNPARIIKSYD